MQCGQLKRSLKRVAYFFKIEKLIPHARDNVPKRTREMTENADRTNLWLNPNDEKTNRDHIEDTLPKSIYATTNSLTTDQEKEAAHQYVERKRSNEFINLAL